MDHGDRDRPALTNKGQMYAALRRGDLGNTLPLYGSTFDWLKSADSDKYPLWGIRSPKAGDPRMRLNVPRDQVADYCHNTFADDPYNISPMIDQWATLRAYVYESPTHPCGLQVTYPTQVDPDSPWRGSFAKYSHTVYGVAARALLRQHLWDNDYADLQELLDLYPGHVVELSACERSVGLIPRHNTIIWEVRRY